MKKTRSQKGITLVALIITIIVLLILAVVAIGAIRNDGIINYAKNARTEYEAAQANEQGFLDEYEGYLENVNTPVGGGEDSVFATITTANYGDTITYSAGGVTDWKVFYKDDSNLYIIASDYLANTNLPTGLNMSTYETYGAYWSLTDAFTRITTEVANKYNLSWLADNASSTNNNARAVGDLLNVEAWTEKFGDTSKGIEAIGAPTLEMWVKSWNAKGTAKGTDKYVPLKTEYNATGYFVGPTTTTSLADIADNYDDTLGGYNYNVGTSTEGYADTMYFPYTAATSNCYGYWLASPSANLSSRVMSVDCSGDVNYDRYDSLDSAVRPLVSLPSSVITTNADGSLAVAQ